MTGDKILFEPEMRNIEMLKPWWDDRIAEFGSNGKFVKVLQSKPLPFKELLEEIYGQHDLDQDDRYSPFMRRERIQQMQEEEASDEEIAVCETPEEISFDPSNIRASDDEFPTREQVQRSSPRVNRSSMRVRNTSTKRPNRRRVNFETQIQSGFQRMEDSRTNLLDVLRSRHHQKATFGDSLAVLETLQIEPIGKFWWAANGLLVKDEDIRDGFMKLRSDENKTQFLERLSGVDRYGDPCQIINLKETCNTPTSSVPITHSQMAGFNTTASTSFYPGLGLFETRSSGTSFSALLGTPTPNLLGSSSGIFSSNNVSFYRIFALQNYYHVGSKIYPMKSLRS
ncbi:unnamed protein product [Arabis nemorensis]|uniref:Uncharacterized protein n=1 Tax=Arabis nemorensis TaxID=586526 RepID=A0A565CPH8_9BRAS|nr:unnamed protein product [Arabis nemorensis]